jgi:hypothetical protein
MHSYFLTTNEPIETPPGHLSPWCTLRSEGYCAFLHLHHISLSHIEGTPVKMHSQKAQIVPVRSSYTDSQVARMSWEASYVGLAWSPIDIL